MIYKPECHKKTTHHSCWLRPFCQAASISRRYLLGNWVQHWMHLPWSWPCNFRRNENPQRVTADQQVLVWWWISRGIYMGCISTMCIYILYIYIFIMEILFHIQQIVTAKHYFLYSGEQHIILYTYIYIFPRISRVVCHSLRFPPHQSTRGFRFGGCHCPTWNIHIRQTWWLLDKTMMSIWWTCTQFGDSSRLSNHRIENFTTMKWSNKWNQHEATLATNLLLGDFLKACDIHRFSLWRHLPWRRDRCPCDISRSLGAKEIRCDWKFRSGWDSLSTYHCFLKMQMISVLFLALVRLVGCCSFYWVFGTLSNFLNILRRPSGCALWCQVPLCWRRELSQMEP